MHVATVSGLTEPKNQKPETPETCTTSTIPAWATAQWVNPAMATETDPLPPALHGIRFDSAELNAICQRHHVARLQAYGSILRADFSPDSDIDLIIEFEPGHTVGWEFFDLEADLASVLGREVDLTTPEGLSKYIRDLVLDEARTVYVH